jgi:hypothetical protein
MTKPTAVDLVLASAQRRATQNDRVFQSARATAMSYAFSKALADALQYGISAPTTKYPPA